MASSLFLETVVWRSLIAVQMGLGRPYLRIGSTTPHWTFI